jgi:hypothetical protein
MELKNKRISDINTEYEIDSCECGCLGETSTTDKEITSQDSTKKTPDRGVYNC